METQTNEIPVMGFGKYKGVRYDALPVSYCRWLLSQDFQDKELIEHAKRKVMANPTSQLGMEVTRHAMDSYSLRFIKEWNGKIGLGSFIAMKATEAYEHGKDVSKTRHKDEQIIKEFEGIKWVFNRSGSITCLLTVMS